ncbi:MAG: T9SS type A sorting domain-containing protein [Ferruginibacter sp.]|nr:T9SS type A sorting domain-containing protein [Ferruginibacter sp.]
MKQFIQLLFLIFFTMRLTAQISLPQVQANFGIEADLRTNFFNGSLLNGNDDWFSSGDTGTGIFVIDTTGAAGIVNGYGINPATLNYSFIRNMKYPSSSVINNRLMMDAVFVRDFHGDDSTVFAAGSNKNAQNPNIWSTPIAQSVPAKNEILDVFMHVRREGPTGADALWMFGGISIENTKGNRYFDFEMFQTDIFYDRSILGFTGYGPDVGHSSWTFDSVGNVTKSGDIILTAEYSSSALTFIEARIWINKNDLSIVPANFNWSGQFDGANAGAQFGYASIVPIVGKVFYSGLQSASNTWGGPFKIVLAGNSVVANYTAGQFMEIAVNLTKLGLDPVLVLGGSTCDRPFQKVLVKTRASTSFTAELKDFVGPFDFAVAPKVRLFTDVPIFCGVKSVSNLKVVAPVASYVYDWSTTDGHILDSSINTSIFVDEPGTYVVSLKQLTGCKIIARDTVVITFDPFCGILANRLLKFSGNLVNDKVNLTWQMEQNEKVAFYQVERSIDGVHFYPAGIIYPDKNKAGLQYLSNVDAVKEVRSLFIYYRLKIFSTEKVFSYSSIIKIDLANSAARPFITITPNPVTDVMLLNIFSPSTKKIQVIIYNGVGKAMHIFITAIKQGKNSFTLTDFKTWQRDIYTVKVFIENDVFVKKILLAK